jgi:hypothetical protein
MRTGRHASRGAVDWLVVAGCVSVIAGVCILPAAIDKLLRYSPVGDPSAGPEGFTLLGACLVLIGVPVAALAVGLVVAGIRRHNAWMRTLTPRERLLVHFAESAAMEAGHIAMRDHNRREDARLSDSVIGTEKPE